MSFANTKTPTKPKGKARYQLPMRPNAKFPYIQEYYLEGELLNLFCKLFPKHSNQRMMKWFGISFSTCQRFKRELGLEKDMKAIRKELAKDIKKKCEKNGYYDSMRGKAPTPQCIEAYKQKVAAGWFPMKDCKENNPRRYKRLMKKRREHRIEVERSERIRVRIGLCQNTDLHRPAYKFSRRQVCYRNGMKKFGYILGDMADNSGERYTIFYDAETERHPKKESNASQYGFSIKPLPK